MINEQKVVESISNAANNSSSIFRSILIYVLIFVAGIGSGMFIEYKIINPQLEKANQLIAQYDQRIKSLDTEKEKVLIENAKLKLKEPEKVYIAGETKTEYVYTEKQSQSDPDVKINDKGQEIKIAYNGQSFNLPMKQTTN